MTIHSIRRSLLLMVLALVQVLVLNHIHILGVATPLLYLLLPVRFDSEQKRWSALAWCFTLGLVVEIFSNTPGMVSCALTFIGLIQPRILRLFVQGDESEICKPSLSVMGWLRYTSYLLVLVLVFCLLFFTLEFFTFFNLLLWIESVVGSTVLTVIILIALAKINDVKS